MVRVQLLVERSRLSLAQLNLDLSAERGALIYALFMPQTLRHNIRDGTSPLLVIMFRRMATCVYVVPGINQRITHIFSVQGGGGETLVVTT